MNNILSKLDRSIACYLQANDLPAHPAKSTGEKSLPCVVVYSSKAVPVKDAPFAGCYDVVCLVGVKTEVLDGLEEQSDSFADTLADLLVPGGNNHQDGTQVAAAIEAEARLNDIAITIEDVTLDAIEAEPAENHWRDSVMLAVRCYPSNIE
ncbi:hypothetical protein SDC9_159559 [bioreactor metagenome]|uniref:Uncharacterized protein n=1 Tax=bioreactor metagenome TaxID=1076179 RepID=A0A645FCY2_9ZZZZ